MENEQAGTGENPILKICPWARKHMAAEVRLRVENALHSAQVEEAKRLARQKWLNGIVTRHIAEPGGIDGAIKMAEESVACAYAAWTMLKRTRTSAYTPKAVERLGEIESLINHAGSALNGIKVLVSLEKWVL